MSTCAARRLAAGVNEMSVVRIGTRDSQLALWQAHHIAGRINSRMPGVETEIVPIKTEADLRQDVLLAELGGKGLFIKELERALLDHRIDIAVHSMKDVTVDLREEFHIAAILPRENPYDALVSSKYQSLTDLPPNAIIGTCSLRRQSQLLSIRPDLTIVPLRGNVTTRLKRLDDGGCDAIVLAVSGLRRLGLEKRITEILHQLPHIPSPGQGALGVECRLSDRQLIEDLKMLDHEPSHVEVEAERMVNAGLGGSCHVPIGVLANCQADRYELSAYVGRVDARQTIIEKLSGSIDRLSSGIEVMVEKLHQRGAQKILAGV